MSSERSCPELWLLYLRGLHCWLYHTCARNYDVIYKPISKAASELLLSFLCPKQREKKNKSRSTEVVLAAAAAGSRELLLSRGVQLSRQIALSCQLLCPHPPLPSFTFANLRPQLQTPLLLPQLHCTVARGSDLKPKWRDKWCVQVIAAMQIFKR